MSLFSKKSTTADDILNGPIGVSGPAHEAMYDRYLRDQYAAAQAMTNHVKRFPSMWIEPNGNVTLMGQLMIRLHNGNVGIEVGSLMKSFYKDIEIIDVRHARDQVQIYVAVKKGPAFIVTDEPELFPSDKLVTQFRTLAGV